MKVLKFGAKWCEPCNRFEPIFELLKEKFTNVEFKSYDLDIDVEEAYEYKIMQIPTLVFVKDGYEVKRLTGLYDQAFYEDVINASVSN